MSAFVSPQPPAYHQGWNHFLLSDGQYCLCPYTHGKNKELWRQGYKDAMYYYKGDPWIRGKKKYGLEL